MNENKFCFDKSFKKKKRMDNKIMLVETFYETVNH